MRLGSSSYRSCSVSWLSEELAGPLSHQRHFALQNQLPRCIPWNGCKRHWRLGSARNLMPQALGVECDGLKLGAELLVCSGLAGTGLWTWPSIEAELPVLDGYCVERDNSGFRHMRALSGSYSGRNTGEFSM